MERQRWSVDERLEIRTGKLEGTRTYFCLGSRLTLVDSPSVVPLIRAHILGFRIWQLICVELGHCCSVGPARSLENLDKYIKILNFKGKK